MNVPRDSNENVSCVLDDVVTLESENQVIDFAVWDANSRCAGAKGVFPLWFHVPSTCPGPSDCVLLKSGALLYPPDKEVWYPLLTMPDWESKLKPLFSSLPRDTKFDAIREHVLSMKQRWGIVR